MNEKDLLLEQWKMASELHRHMDDMAWQRFNYFITTNGILVSVLAAIVTSDATKVKDSLPPRVIITAIPAFGAVISLVWGLVQKRGQKYQQYRITQVKRTEEALNIDGKRVLDLYKEGLNEQKLVSVPIISRIPTKSLMVALAFLIMVAWFTLFLFFLLHPWP